jgi:hypothetical protein
MRIVAAVAIVAGSLLSAAERKPPKIPVEIQQAIGMAMAAPPEFAADALLRIIAADKIKDHGAQSDVIETAFRLAARSQHPFPLMAAPVSGVDTRSGYVASALRMKLDGLSLQTRAIDLMLRIDPHGARELFAQMPHPHLEPLSCEATLIPQVADYYVVLGRIAAEAFPASERSKEEHAQFIQAHLDRIVSHAELAPALRMIAAVEWTPSQFDVLLGSFLAKMQSIAPDDRTFSVTVYDLDQSISQLIFRARQQNDHPERIVNAYRSYLVANLTAPRCADNASGRFQQVQGGSLELFGDAIRGDLPALDAAEMKPKKVAGEAVIDHYWESAESKRIFEECMRLRVGPDGRMLSVAERNTREWKRQLTDFLAALADWKAADERSEADYYHQRAIVYEALLELTPAGDERNRVLDDYIAFLRGSNLQQENPVEWYWHARSTLNRTRRTQRAEADRMLAAFAGSGSIILSLEAMLARIAPDYSMFPE